MKVCIFGNYDPDYPRNRVLISGLKKNGVEVVECRTRKTGWGKFFQLYRRHRRAVGNYDVMLVAFSGYSVLWFARLLTFKPLIFDAFVSLYLTNVEDRKNCGEQSLRARYYSFLDWFSCKVADRVLLDTHAQIDYFVRRYRLPPEKFFRLFVGADDKIYFPTVHSSPSTTHFLIHWHGHIVPFHGLSVVLATAKLLASQNDIRFRVVTRFNSRYQEPKAKVGEWGITNIEFVPEQAPEKLAALMNEADVCLGIFGNNPKAHLVIPNKIFEAVACAKPVITAGHEVVLELFTNSQNIVFVPPEDPKVLASAILRLKADAESRRLLSRHAYELYQARLTPQVLGLELLHVLFPGDAKT